MRLASKTNQRVVFHLNGQERDLLLAVLGEYPVLPDDFQGLTKSGDPELIRAGQELLEHALAEHREENRRFTQTFLEQKGRFRRHNRGWHLTLQPGEVETLLQVLNNVRIGLWHQSGCPEDWDQAALEALLQGLQPPAHSQFRNTDDLGKLAKNLERLGLAQMAGTLEAQIIELLDQFGY